MKHWLRTALYLCAWATISAAAADAQTIVINEVFYDSPGTDVDTYVELKGPGGQALDGYTLVGVNGNGGVDYQIIDLIGQVIPADGYFVIAENPAATFADMVTSLVDYQNGPDSIQLRRTVAGNTTVVDAIGYDVHGGTDIFAGEGSPTPDQVPPSTLARCPDGFDSQNNAADFVLDATPTPGAANDGVCAAPGAEPHTICEIAEDDFDGVPVLNTVLVQTEGVAIAGTGTWSATTQEFQLYDAGCCVTVFGGNVVPVVAIGDRVRVEGTVVTFNGKTEISSPGLVVTILSSGNPIPAPVDVTTFELSVNGELYESCLIRVQCVTMTGGTWPLDGENQNITIDDGSGATTMRIDRDTNVDGSPAPTGPFTCIGIADQFDTTLPYGDGFQIKPRSLDDLDFITCLPALGACCFQNGNCSVLPEADCTGQGGSYQGDDTLCDPNPCPQPTGACCFHDGHCEVLLATDCANAGGVYYGNNVPCDPNPCQQPFGACCLNDGTCLVLTRTECGLVQGNYLGDDLSCDPNPCPQPTGACCYQDGTCIVYTGEQCAQFGGTYYGNGTVCDPNPCPQPPPTGACCFITGECSIVTAADCDAQLGTYQGDHTVCDPNPCPPPVPTRSSSWGQIKHKYGR